MEAAIIFGRTAIHRLKSRFEDHPQWKAWFAALRGHPSIEFFWEQRDRIVHEAPPKVGQIIGGAPQRAAEMYYYETPDVPATATIRRHLDTITPIVEEAEIKFT